MPKTRRLLTRFSKGELSPLLEGSPDLAAYFEGARALENVLLLRQGGVRRRPGLRYIAEVKYSTKDTVLMPFEFSATDAAVIEVGDGYDRFIKNKAQLMEAGHPVEVATPYAEADLRGIHITQSADVLYRMHGAYQQRKLNRVSDTNWSLSLLQADPPPSFEADTDWSGGTITLTPSATSGTGITLTASAAVFLAADVGRQIVSGAARAIIVGLTSSTVVTADVLDPFPSTTAIPAGFWFFRLSPQTTLDPTLRAPVGAKVTLTAGAAAFRSGDVGKFIKVYGGLIVLMTYTSATSMAGQLLSIMTETTSTDPPAAPAGTWTLEEPSWSDARGWPRTGEFFQGRLAMASTAAQRTTFWLSRTDDFENFGIGTTADAALDYTLASRQINQIQWIADNTQLFIGTAGSEHRLLGSGNEKSLLGGDTVPFDEKIGAHGQAPIQPIVAGGVLCVDRSRRKVLNIRRSETLEGFDVEELTVIAEHITASGVRDGLFAYQKRMDPRLWFIRNDGTLVALTFFPEQRVTGFTRFVTDGTFESVAVIPNAQGGDDQVYVIVRRIINGAERRYIELLEGAHELATGRPWASLQTDSAVVYDGSPTTTITGVTHLEGKQVAVVADGMFRGLKPVIGGVLTLDDAASVVEYGLPYTHRIETMRPSVPGQVIEGLPRSWDDLWVRLDQSYGGTINGQAIPYPGTLGAPTLFTGDIAVYPEGTSTDGRLIIVSQDPYPFTLLAVFGTLEMGDHG